MPQIPWKPKYPDQKKPGTWVYGKFTLTRITSYHPSWRYMLYHSDYTYDLGCYCTRAAVNEYVRRLEREEKERVDQRRKSRKRRPAQAG